ncbi:MAG: S-methyl-5-thioribose-1-phosphate isomerase [candidate division KSB1 bacterium]|nr:S-methyl-5-thioribose-1-phosphate isomerase [candidate division KSB1 bacterium]
MPVKSIEWIQGKVRIIDQTRLPVELVYEDIDDYRVLAQAIRELRIRGAPAIGIAGAFGVVLGIQTVADTDKEGFFQKLGQVTEELKNTRPTAVNLFWALERLRKMAELNSHKEVVEIKELLLKEALAILEEDRETCRKIGRYGAQLIQDGFTVLTHCNAGGLATSEYGTALGVIYTAVEEGKKVRVYADETRPLLQGARLTVWELMAAGIEVTLICDNTAAVVMKQGLIDCVIVGADRIARNGDTANKIGTYNLAVLAEKHGIPFYVAAPLSTFDFNLDSGDQIPIEERAAEEVTQAFGKTIAPQGTRVYNPAFDVTPRQLITAFITDKGLLEPPFEKNILEL